MKNLIGYLAALAVILYTGIIYGSLILVEIAFGGIVFAVFAYGYLFIQYLCLNASFHIPIQLTEQKKQTDLVVTVSNRSILPAAKLQFLLSYQSLATGEKGRLKINGAVLPHTKSTIRTGITGKDCGGYQFTLRKIRIYDLTGIFYVTKRKKERGSLNIMPKIHDISILVGERSRHFAGESEYFDASAPGDDVSEVFQIRPFHNGDKLQSIHWKLSAKTEELMVKENSLPLSCPVVLLLDITGKGKRQTAFYELILSISTALIEQKCDHYVAWYSSMEKDVIRVRVHSEEELYLYLLMLYEEKRNRTERDIATLYLEKYKVEGWVTELYVNRNLELKQNGTLIKKFDSKQLKKELEGVELIV